MIDVLNARQRSYCMSKIKGKNTKPEVVLRKAIWNLGYRYRLQTKLAGRPDLIFSPYKVVVFVDGCFWHKCPAHFVQPKTRPEFWKNKINSNAARDRRNNEILQSEGWKVVRIWEHEINQSIEDSVARVVDALESQRVALRVKVKDC